MIWHRIVVTTEPATATSPGAIAEGTYTIAGDKIRVKNDRGKLVGTAEFVPGEDAALIARRILRRGRAQSDFHQPLRYPPLSIV